MEIGSVATPCEMQRHHFASASATWSGQTWRAFRIRSAGQPTKRRRRKKFSCPVFDPCPWWSNGLFCCIFDATRWCVSPFWQVLRKSFSNLSFSWVLVPSVSDPSAKFIFLWTIILRVFVFLWTLRYLSCSEMFFLSLCKTSSDNFTFSSLSIFASNLCSKSKTFTSPTHTILRFRHPCFFLAFCLVVSLYLGLKGPRFPQEVQRKEGNLWSFVRLWSWQTCAFWPWVHVLCRVVQWNKLHRASLLRKAPNWIWAKIVFKTPTKMASDRV